MHTFFVFAQMHQHHPRMAYGEYSTIYCVKAIGQHEEIMKQESVHTTTSRTINKIEKMKHR